MTLKITKAKKNNAFTNSLARIYDPSGMVVGAGYLVSSRWVLTCAHVVSFASPIKETPERDAVEEACSKERMEKEEEARRKGAEEGRTKKEVERSIKVIVEEINKKKIERLGQIEAGKKEIRIDFPFTTGNKKYTAQIRNWIKFGQVEGGDVCLLELENFPAGVPSTCLIDYATEELSGHHFRVCGFPSGQDNGIWADGTIKGRQVSGWVQIESDRTTGYAIQPGFSGSPVWDEHLEGVVGIIVGCDWKPEETKTAFIVPTETIKSVFLTDTARQESIKGFSPLEKKLLLSHPWKEVRIFKIAAYGTMILSALVVLVFAARIASGYLQGSKGAAGVSVSSEETLSDTNTPVSTNTPISENLQISGATGVIVELQADSCDATIKIYNQNSNTRLLSMAIQAGTSQTISLPPGNYRYEVEYSCIDLSGASGSTLEGGVNVTQDMQTIINLPARHGIPIWP